MTTKTSFPRVFATVLMPVMLFMLACAATLAVVRRRPIAAPPEPQALPPALPTVDRFEILTAGRSALLRVHADPAPEPTDAVLVLDQGESMDLISALPNAMASGALGFTCDRALVAATQQYWLQLAAGTVGLPEPVERTI